jgi:hypothetical protein
MTDDNKTIHTKKRPNLYFQEQIKHPDGSYEYKDAGVAWENANFSKADIELDGKRHKIYIRTRDQREALFAMREQQKQQAQGQSQEQSQAPVTDKPDYTPSM